MTTLARSPETSESAPVKRQRQNPALRYVVRSGGSTTPAGAEAKIRRHIAFLCAVAIDYTKAGRESDFDKLLLPLDEIRQAGLTISPSIDILCAIESADASDEVPRAGWFLTRTTESARKALTATNRAVAALLAFRRVLFGQHPELTP